MPNTNPVDIQLPMVPAAAGQAIHVGAEEIPYIPIEEGVEVQVLHVDLKRGMWIVRNRFQPGTTIQRHYHTGAVYAVTLEGQWFYQEYPDEINSPGSYLFESAGSIHTLTIPKDQQGPTVVWFAIYGPNVHLTEDDKVDNILDANTMLQGYRQLTEAFGQASDVPIVEGE